MSFLLLIPVIISSLLMAAHCMRWGSPILVFACLAIPCLLLFKKCWVARFMQLYLVIAALEWCRSMYIFVQQRIEVGEPWVRLVVILGAVAVITAASACVFFTKRLKTRYGLLWG